MDDREYRQRLREIGAMMDSLGMGRRKYKQSTAKEESGWDRYIQKRTEQFNAALLALREDCRRTGRRCPL